MPTDKEFDGRELDFLGLRERKLLEQLASDSGRTVFAELKWLIRRRALGHLKDLGDDRGSFRLPGADLQTFHVGDAEFPDE